VVSLNARGRNVGYARDANNRLGSRSTREKLYSYWANWLPGSDALNLSLRLDEQPQILELARIAGSEWIVSNS
jgi:hypothetical protein